MADTGPGRETQAVDAANADLVLDKPLTVVDVALHYGAGYDRLGTYLRAKRRYAERSVMLVHHAIVPAAAERHRANYHELPSSRHSRGDTYHFGARPQELLSLLNEITADVVAVHGPFPAATRVIKAARWTGATIVAVPHRVVPSSADRPSWHAGRWWTGRAERRALSGVDVVIEPAGVDSPAADGVRLGIDPEFRTVRSARRIDTVVFAGELSWSSGIAELLEAASYASAPWRLLLVGHGRHARAIERRAADYGLAHRVQIQRFITDRRALAETFSRAGCVVSPGSPQRGQLVTLEAAASGVPVVVPAGAPIATIAPELTHTYPAHSVEGLAGAIRSALKSSAPDAAKVDDLHRVYTWERVFERELSELSALS